VSAAPDLQTVLDVLRQERPKAREAGIELVGVVGSVARGDAGPDSDVDVVYDVVGHATLFTLGGLLMDLQDRLGRRVDLVDMSVLEPRRRAYMERDLVRA